MQRADRIHAHRETIGQLKRETTAQQLVSPKLKEGVERDELKARIMPDLVTQTVADETIKVAHARSDRPSRLSPPCSLSLSPCHVPALLGSKAPCTPA